MTPIGTGVLIGASAVAALACTPLARRLAFRVGAVATPKSDRWHKRPTALLGGVAIVAASIAGLLTAMLIMGSGIRADTVSTRPALGIGLSAAVMFVVGLVDDLVRLRAQTKFLFQLLAGVVLVSLGSLLPLTPWYVANVLATLFFFVALTNAFNLLDGLDGVDGRIGQLVQVREPELVAAVEDVLVLGLHVLPQEPLG